MKIVTVCGMGFGTSLMLLMEVQAMGKKAWLSDRRGGC